MLLSLLFKGSGIHFLEAQQIAPIQTVKTKHHSDFLLFPNGDRLVFHTGKDESILTLYNEGNQKLDEYAFQALEQPLLVTLSDNRCFLQLGDFAYNFSIEKGNIVLEEKVEIIPGPEGTIDRIHFFDREKSVRMYLNKLEQFNVYIDSAGVRIKELEKYNSPYRIQSKDLVPKPKNTPKIIYSQWTKELFFHLPADASFLSVDLGTNEISIGVIRMEYKQSYTFRRYFDEWKDQRYVLKEDGAQLPELFPVSSFSVVDFAKEYNLLKKTKAIQFVPIRIINEKLLYRKVEEKNNHWMHTYYLIEPDFASQKNFLEQFAIHKKE